MLSAVLSSQLELSALALLTILLYSYRYVIGQAPLYIMVGIHYIFALLSDIPVDYSAASTSHAYELLGNGFLWLPFLLLLLVIFELEGIRAAQRFFLGLIFATICFFSMLMIAYGLFSNDAPVFIRDFVAIYSGYLKAHGQMGMLVSALKHFSIFIMTPSVYQACRNNNIPKGGAIMMVMVTYLTLNEALGILYTVTMGGVKAYTLLPPWQWGMRLCSACCMSLIGHVYLDVNADYALRHPAKRKVFGFLTEFTAFLPSAEKMSRSLDEWAERYEVVVENSSEMILLLDQNGQLINANRSAVKYFGELLKQPDFSLEKWIVESDGTPWKCGNVLHPGDMHNEHGTLKNVFQFRNLSMRLPGQKRVELDINVSHTTYNNAQIAVVIAHDVTIEREKERQRESQIEMMMHSQRLESIGALAGGIAHDFNNLMQSVQASVEALNVKYRPEGEAARLLDNVDEACRRAAKLTGQLLGFAHKGKFHTEKFELQSILEHILQLFRSSAKSIECRLLCEPDPLFIECDEVQMSQVFLNMLLNSRDAIQERQKIAPPDYRPRITLRAEKANDTMREWSARPQGFLNSRDFVCVHIRDNGCGMDENTRNRMFDPFFTTKPIGKGTGMGMAMAFGCIANHHGFIHVHSTPGNGCDIAVFLPRAK